MNDVANESDQESERGARQQRKRWTIVFGVVVTLLTEAVTLYLRFGRGQTAADFNKTAPLLLQIHHMFWSVPLLAALPVRWRWPRLSGAIAGTAIGFIVSDLLHHFVVLPLAVGNTGWHWP
jgi:hypothetical protein